MMNCYVTGIFIKYNSAYLLDITEARKAVIELNKRIKSIKRFVEQFGVMDDVEFEDWETGNIEIRRHHRLVSKTVADVFNETCPYNNIFISFDEFKRNKASRNKWKGGGENVE